MGALGAHAEDCILSGRIVIGILGLPGEMLELKEIFEVTCQ